MPQRQADTAFKLTNTYEWNLNRRRARRGIIKERFVSLEGNLIKRLRFIYIDLNIQFVADAIKNGKTKHSKSFDNILLFKGINGLFAQYSTYNQIPQKTSYGLKVRIVLNQ